MGRKAPWDTQLLQIQMVQELGASVQHFSYQCSASSLPCTQSIYSKFPFFSKLPPERENPSQLRVSLSQWEKLSVSCAVVAAHWGLAGH